MADYLRIENLKKYFRTAKGTVHAVDDVSFSIERGKTLGVVGESGCGKSTLGRCIIHLLEPTSGKIFFDGADITKPTPEEQKALRQRMQMIFQDPFSSLNPRMSVADIIAEPMKVCKIYPTNKQIYARVNELMDVVGLARRFVNAYPHELDGGRRQRIGIARALAVNPEFIVCDEPVSALDVSIQAQILNLLMDLQENMGLTYMFVTHDLSVVKHISNEIAVMYLGQCVEKAPADELFAAPRHPYTKALLSAVPKPSLRAKGALQNVIKGEVSNPINPKPGCRFAARCEHACEACTRQDLQLESCGPEHYVACALVHEGKI